MTPSRDYHLPRGGALVVTSTHEFKECAPLVTSTRVSLQNGLKPVPQSSRQAAARAGSKKKRDITVPFEDFFIWLLTYHLVYFQHNLCTNSCDIWCIENKPPCIKKVYRCTKKSVHMYQKPLFVYQKNNHCVPNFAGCV